eukprot:Nk52_evm11s225 gene=Nk52_evmTU11s225
MNHQGEALDIEEPKTKKEATPESMVKPEAGTETKDKTKEPFGDLKGSSREGAHHSWRQFFKKFIGRSESTQSIGFRRRKIRMTRFNLLTFMSLVFGFTFLILSLQWLMKTKDSIAIIESDANTSASLTLLVGGCDTHIFVDNTAKEHLVTYSIGEYDNSRVNVGPITATTSPSPGVPGLISQTISIQSDGDFNGLRIQCSIDVALAKNKLHTVPGLDIIYNDHSAQHQKLDISLGKECSSGHFRTQANALRITGSFLQVTDVYDMSLGNSCAFSNLYVNLQHGSIIFKHVHVPSQSQLDTSLVDLRTSVGDVVFVLSTPNMVNYNFYHKRGFVCMPQGRWIDRESFCEVEEANTPSVTITSSTTTTGNTTINSQDQSITAERIKYVDCEGKINSLKFVSQNVQDSSLLSTISLTTHTDSGTIYLAPDSVRGIALDSGFGTATSVVNSTTKVVSPLDVLMTQVEVDKTFTSGHSHFPKMIPEHEKALKTTIDGMASEAQKNSLVIFRYPSIYEHSLWLLTTREIYLTLSPGFLSVVSGTLLKPAIISQEVGMSPGICPYQRPVDNKGTKTVGQTFKAATGETNYEKVAIKTSEGILVVNVKENEDPSDPEEILLTDQPVVIVAITFSFLVSVLSSFAFLYSLLRSGYSYILQRIKAGIISDRYVALYDLFEISEKDDIGDVGAGMGLGSEGYSLPGDRRGGIGTSDGVNGEEGLDTDQNMDSNIVDDDEDINADDDQNNDDDDDDDNDDAGISKRLYFAAIIKAAVKLPATSTVIVDILYTELDLWTTNSLHAFLSHACTITPGRAAAFDAFLSTTTSTSSAGLFKRLKRFGTKFKLYLFPASSPDESGEDTVLTEGNTSGESALTSGKFMSGSKNELQLSKFQSAYEDFCFRNRLRELNLSRHYGYLRRHGIYLSVRYDFSTEVFTKVEALSDEQRARAAITYKTRIQSETSLNKYIYNTIKLSDHDYDCIPVDAMYFNYLEYCHQQNLQPEPFKKELIAEFGGDLESREFKFLQNVVLNDNINAPYSIFHRRSWRKRQFIVVCLQYFIGVLLPIPALAALLLYEDEARTLSIHPEEILSIHDLLEGPFRYTLLPPDFMTKASELTLLVFGMVVLYSILFLVETTLFYLIDFNEAAVDFNNYGFLRPFRSKRGQGVKHSLKLSSFTIRSSSKTLQLRKRFKQLRKIIRIVLLTLTAIWVLSAIFLVLLVLVWSILGVIVNPVKLLPYASGTLTLYLWISIGSYDVWLTQTSNFAKITRMIQVKFDSVISRTLTSTIEVHHDNGKVVQSSTLPHDHSFYPNRGSMGYSGESTGAAQGVSRVQKVHIEQESGHGLDMNMKARPKNSLQLYNAVISDKALVKSISDGNSAAIHQVAEIVGIDEDVLCLIIAITIGNFPLLSRGVNNLCSIGKLKAPPLLVEAFIKLCMNRNESLNSREMKNLLGQLNGLMHSKQHNIAHHAKKSSTAVSARPSQPHNFGSTRPSASLNADDQSSKVSLRPSELDFGSMGQKHTMGSTSRLETVPRISHGVSGVSKSYLLDHEGEFCKATGDAIIGLCGGEFRSLLNKMKSQHLDYLGSIPKEYIELLMGCSKRGADAENNDMKAKVKLFWGYQEKKKEERSGASCISNSASLLEDVLRVITGDLGKRCDTLAQALGVQESVLAGIFSLLHGSRGCVVPMINTILNTNEEVSKRFSLKKRHLDKLKSANLKFLHYGDSGKHAKFSKGYGWEDSRNGAGYSRARNRGDSPHSGPLSEEEPSHIPQQHNNKAKARHEEFSKCASSYVLAGLFAISYGTDMNFLQINNECGISPSCGGEGLAVLLENNEENKGPERLEVVLSSLARTLHCDRLRLSGVMACLMGNYSDGMKHLAKDIYVQKSSNNLLTATALVTVGCSNDIFEIEWALVILFNLMVDKKGMGAHALRSDSKRSRYRFNEVAEKICILRQNDRELFKMFVRLEESSVAGFLNDVYMPQRFREVQGVINDLNPLLLLDDEISGLETFNILFSIIFPSSGMYHYCSSILAEHGISPSSVQRGFSSYASMLFNHAQSKRTAELLYSIVFLARDLQSDIDGLERRVICQTLSDFIEIDVDYFTELVDITFGRIHNAKGVLEKVLPDVKTNDWLGKIDNVSIERRYLRQGLEVLCVLTDIPFEVLVGLLDTGTKTETSFILRRAIQALFNENELQLHTLQELMKSKDHYHCLFSHIRFTELSSWEEKKSKRDSILGKTLPPSSVTGLMSFAQGYTVIPTTLTEFTSVDSFFDEADDSAAIQSLLPFIIGDSFMLEQYLLNGKMTGWEYIFAKGGFNQEQQVLLKSMFHIIELVSNYDPNNPAIVKPTKYVRPMLESKVISDSISFLMTKLGISPVYMKALIAAGCQDAESLIYYLKAIGIEDAKMDKGAVPVLLNIATGKIDYIYRLKDISNVHISVLEGIVALASGNPVSIPSSIQGVANAMGLASMGKVLTSIVSLCYSHINGLEPLAQVLKVDSATLVSLVSMFSRCNDTVSEHIHELAVLLDMKDTSLAAALVTFINGDGGLLAMNVSKMDIGLSSDEIKHAKAVLSIVQGNQDQISIIFKSIGRHLKMRRRNLGPKIVALVHAAEKLFDSQIMKGIVERQHLGESLAGKSSAELRGFYQQAIVLGDEDYLKLNSKIVDNIINPAGCFQEMANLTSLSAQELYQYFEKGIGVDVYTQSDQAKSRKDPLSGNSQDQDREKESNEKKLGIEAKKGILKSVVNALGGFMSKAKDPGRGIDQDIHKENHMTNQYSQESKKGSVEERLWMDFRLQKNSTIGDILAILRSIYKLAKVKQNLMDQSFYAEKRETIASDTCPQSGASVVLPCKELLENIRRSYKDVVTSKVAISGETTDVLLALVGLGAGELFADDTRYREYFASISALKDRLYMGLKCKLKSLKTIAQLCSPLVVHYSGHAKIPTWAQNGQVDTSSTNISETLRPFFHKCRIRTEVGVSMLHILKGNIANVQLSFKNFANECSIDRNSAQTIVLCALGMKEAWDMLFKELGVSKDIGKALIVSQSFAKVSRAQERFKGPLWLMDRYRFISYHSLGGAVDTTSLDMYEDVKLTENSDTEYMHKKKNIVNDKILNYKSLTKDLSPLCAFLGVDSMKALLLMVSASNNVAGLIDMTVYFVGTSRSARRIAKLLGIAKGKKYTNDQLSSLTEFSDASEGIINALVGIAFRDREYLSSTFNFSVENSNSWLTENLKRERRNYHKGKMKFSYDNNIPGKKESRKREEISLTGLFLGGLIALLMSDTSKDAEAPIAFVGSQCGLSRVSASNQPKEANTNRKDGTSLNTSLSNFPVLGSLLGFKTRETKQIDMHLPGLVDHIMGMKQMKGKKYVNPDSLRTEIGYILKCINTNCKKSLAYLIEEGLDFDKEAKEIGFPTICQKIATHEPIKKEMTQILAFFFERGTPEQQKEVALKNEGKIGLQRETIALDATETRFDHLMHSLLSGNVKGIQKDIDLLAKKHDCVVNEQTSEDRFDYQRSSKAHHLIPSHMDKEKNKKLKCTITSYYFYDIVKMLTDKATSQCEGERGSVDKKIKVLFEYLLVRNHIANILKRTDSVPGMTIPDYSRDGIFFDALIQFYHGNFEVLLDVICDMEQIGVRVEKPRDGLPNEHASRGPHQNDERSLIRNITMVLAGEESLHGDSAVYIAKALRFNKEAAQTLLLSKLCCRDFYFDMYMRLKVNKKVGKAQELRTKEKDKGQGLKTHFPAVDAESGHGSLNTHDILESVSDDNDDMDGEGGSHPSSSNNIMDAMSYTQIESMRLAYEARVIERYSSATLNSWCELAYQFYIDGVGVLRKRAPRQIEAYVLPSAVEIMDNNASDAATLRYDIEREEEQFRILLTGANKVLNVSHDTVVGLMAISQLHFEALGLLASQFGHCDVATIRSIVHAVRNEKKNVQSLVNHSLKEISDKGSKRLALLNIHHTSKMKMSTIFRAFDVDESGDLGVEEFHELLKYLGVPMSKSKSMRLFVAVDKDANGCIDYIEFEKLYSLLKRFLAQRVATLLGYDYFTLIRDLMLGLLWLIMGLIFITTGIVAFANQDDEFSSVINSLLPLIAGVVTAGSRKKRRSSSGASDLDDSVDASFGGDEEGFDM